MVIVTLTTDWGLKDHYLGSVKGSLLKAISDVNIIDISHDIPPFDIYQASFILRNSFPNFPENTIHLIGINTESSIDNPHILVQYANQYFIGADNGIFSLMFGNLPTKIVEIDIVQDSNKFTFSTNDVFVKVAKHISEGKPILELGYERSKLNKLMSFEPVIERVDKEISIIGKVIYIDNYKNAIVNIRKELFDEVGKGKPFNISFNSFQNSIHQISQSYGDVAPGDMVAIFDSNDFLEIGINQGNAGSLLGLKVDSKIRISFLF